tara:strand:+ start:6802 stop:7401 length:600 start_codon:yes stop_codon:yes gene_type:complete
MFRYLIAAIALAFATPVAAGVVFDNATKNLVITGRTTNLQASKIYRIMKDNDVMTVTISGNGGEYYAGLRIGRLIRNEGSVVIIPAGTRAVSAAAFAALGADKILVDGELWFHTPYLTAVPTNATILEITQMFGRAYVDMTTYLISVGIPTSFAHDLLVRTSPKKFVVVDDGAQIDRIRATEVLWSKAIYEYRYATSGG